MSIIERAKGFAQAAHIKQKRKYTGEPYFHHCEEVVSILTQAGIADEDILAAAYLHDVVEDTDITIEEIYLHFGNRVADFVKELTDISKPEDGNRAIRKAIDAIHLAHASSDAQTIKYADLLSNTPSILLHDPRFGAVYLSEKAGLLKVMGKGCSALKSRCLELLEESGTQP